jgi:hypothetical protein
MINRMLTVTLTDALEIRRRAEQHKPIDRSALRAEAMRLMRENGWRVRDVAEAFGLNPADVLSLLINP